MELENLKPRVLYVDDEQENLLVFRSTFRRYFDILTANSASEAGNLLLDQVVDVIISDQRMPDMSGVDFLKSLPDTQNNIRIIMTGYSDIGAVVDALNSGKIYKYIPKPWEKDSLLDMITDAVSHLQEIRNLPEHTRPAQRKESSVVNESEEIQLLKKQVEESKKNLHLLGEIGQEISSTLDMNSILNAVYENVNQLMDAYTFGIGIYNAEESTIDYQLAIENGVRFKPYTRSMEEKDQFPVWCIENRKEVFINDVEKEYVRYIRNYEHSEKVAADLEDGSKWSVAHSIIYMPLMVKEKIIGLITVQSNNKDAYSEYHLNTLRNIAIYVATALENAKAYKEIEEKKEEIEKKKTELELRVKERTEQLKHQKDELEETFSKLKLLTEIGQEISSTLNLDTILNTIYENINNLMDATVFGIGIYHADEEIIEYRLAIENGLRYQPYTRSMEDKNQFPVWCIENKSEIFINDVAKDSGKYLNEELNGIVEAPLLEDGTRAKIPTSLIYIPLLFDNKPIGVLTVQSYRKYAYNPYHLDFLRSLATYITTAIQNAGSYQKMTAAFEQLKSAQTKLVESEKMASLGVLTAGVAHEINNPVNFISGGIQSLDDNYADLKNLVELMLQYIRKPDETLQKTILEKEKQLQLEQLLPEMEALIESVKHGAKRTSDIVKGLRNFSRLDEDDMKRASLEEGIESTLVILNNQLKNRIEVKRDFGNIPELMCFPGQLNQVFMNILYNAADAIIGKGEIHINTRVENNQVKISFADSGSGMPEEIRAHIFEPFFTTKPVGKGTGLGLSIAYGIIEKHKGSIEVESEPGKGTTFKITLPVK
ncbi:MAG: GAF domain-containing protein [Bacteroidia bacterium]|jgi:signal transduction histidine kinase/response regulator RpfG family c-di-GMP phosphodiesterase